MSRPTIICDVNTVIPMRDRYPRRKLPVVMELSGNCSNCDGLGLSAYDVPSSMVIPPNDNDTDTDTDTIFFEDQVRTLFESDSALGRVFSI